MADVKAVGPADGLFGWAAVEEEGKHGRDPWDEVRLGSNEPLPGVARVSGSFSRKVDVALSPGTDGSTLTDLGYQPASIEITLTMWTNIQLVEWEGLLPKLRPKPGKGIGEALDISHPATRAAGIRSVYITSVTLPQPGEVTGTVSVTIQCIEYRKSTPAPATRPKQSRLDLTRQRTVVPVGPAQTPVASAPFSAPVSTNPWSGD